MSEVNVIAQVIEKLPESVPETIQVAKVKPVKETRDMGVDLVAELLVNNQPVSMAVEVKDTQSLARLRQAAVQIKDWSTSYSSLPTISGMYLGERARKLLKSEGVNYFDLAGNFYLKSGEIYLEKIVDKNPFTKKSPLQNIFAPKSSRISRALLVEPKRHWKLQELADSTGISLSQAFKTLERLLEEEFVGEDNQGQYYLLQYEELLKEWAKVAADYKNKKFSFYSFERDYPKRLQLLAEQGSTQKLQYGMSFFTGTDLVAPFIRNITKTQFYIASELELDKWKQSLQLEPVDSGASVEIYVPYDEGVFYKSQHIEVGEGRPSVNVVSNVQLYLDVVNSPARGKEQAEFLLDNVLLKQTKG